MQGIFQKQEELTKKKKRIRKDCLDQSYLLGEQTSFPWASIKPGTWNMPEHSGTSRNIPEHPGT